jgi:hypothetical protein
MTQTWQIAGPKRQQRIVLAAIATATLVILALAQSQHRYLIPPYENDVGGFAMRATSWQSSIRLDGFYPLGYPVLLWLLGHLAGGVMAAAKWVAIGSSALLLGASWLLNRLLLPQEPEWLLPLFTAINPYFWQSALFFGTDMPWAGWQCLAMVGAAFGLRKKRWMALGWAGAALGIAYLMRYTAMGMWPVLLLVLAIWRPLPRESRDNLKGAIAFTLAFLIVASPQFAITWAEKGTPFFTLQAKNVWFGIYGGGDWAARWTDARSDIGLLDVFLMGPARFIAHWAAQYARWWAYAGVIALGVSRGALDLAPGWARVFLVALAAAPAAFMAAHLWRRRWRLPLHGIDTTWAFLGLFFAAYGVGIALVFVQPRFYLGLLPLLLVGWACTARWLWSNASDDKGLRVALTLALIGPALNGALLVGSSLIALQPPVGEIVAALERSGAQENDLILSTQPFPYTVHTDYAIAGLPRDVESLDGLRSTLASSQAGYFLYDSAYGPTQWPALDSLGAEALPPFLETLYAAPNSRALLFRVVGEE